jgi:hypothetical protein
VRAGLKACSNAAKDCYDKNRGRREGGLATTAYYMSLSLPNLCHISRWLPEWNPHVVEVTPHVEEVVPNGTLKTGHRNQGLQAMMHAMEWPCT